MIIWKDKYLKPILGFALVVIVTGLYWPMTGHDFINYDDRQYILENSHVIDGLTWSNFVWSFQCGYAANWHPLTWISHMVDCELYGLNPGGHHLTNLFLHAANTVLLFLLMNGMTGKLWRSFFVAAFFGLHPVHVESVAWASERKDVLSGCFWILTMSAYVCYARRPGLWRYLLTLLIFTLGLMSKPMLVTLPFVLLLIDFWPLNRMRGNGFGRSSPYQPEAAAVSPGASTKAFAQIIKRLVLEKVPFFALTLAASILTYIAQNSAGAVRSWIELPFGVRCANAVMSYCRYIGKTFWPANLALIYPYQEHWPLSLVALGAVLLLIVSIWLVLNARRIPYAIVGWLWFLGTLVPTLGLVQVGAQAMADRYMYVPSIGLFILVVWGVSNAVSTHARVRKCVVVIGVAALSVCMVCTRVQLRYWRNSEDLFRHVVNVTSDNYIAYICLGKLMVDADKQDEALDFFRTAVRIAPTYPLAQYNLGTTLIHKGELDKAITHFAMAVQDDPKMAEAQNNWGKALLDQGKLNEATKHFAEAFKLQPDNPEISYNLGTLLLKQSTNMGAIVRFADAIRLKPEYAAALGNLKVAVMNLGGPDKAIGLIAEAAKENPGDPLLPFSSGLVLLEQGRAAEAESRFAEALRLKPGDAGFNYYLAAALIQQHKSANAIAHLEATLRLQPDNEDALNSLAWILACSPRSERRAGKEAVRLAKRACDLSRNEQAAYVITLAAAYANVGRFSEAILSAQKARELALANGEEEAAERARTLQNLFESHQTVAESLNSSVRPD
jgi:tetratricopeptide (TPR) repeat protein